MLPIRRAQFFMRITYTTWVGIYSLLQLHCAGGIDNSNACASVVCATGRICVNGACEPDPNYIKDAQLFFDAPVDIGVQLDVPFGMDHTVSGDQNAMLDQSTDQAVLLDTKPPLDNAVTDVKTDLDQSVDQPVDQPIDQPVDQPIDTGCTPQCSGKTCGSSNTCGGTCQTGSGCCTPSCNGQLCGNSNGCGGTCQEGSGCCGAASCSNGCCTTSGVCSSGTSNSACGDNGQLCSNCTSNGQQCQNNVCTTICTPSCSGKPCNTSDGCGGTCQTGSGCCNNSCSGVICGQSNGCGSTCETGSGCCATVGPPCCSGTGCCSFNLFSSCQLSTGGSPNVWYGGNTKISQVASQCPGVSQFQAQIPGTTSFYVYYAATQTGTDFDLSCAKPVFMY